MHDPSQSTGFFAKSRRRLAVGALSGLLLFAAGQAISMDPQDSDEKMDELGLPHIPERVLGQLPQLCAKTEVAIIGTINSVVQNQNGPTSSSVTFQVERVLHGNVGQTVAVYMPVGVKNGHWVTKGAFPHVQPDQRYLLFLADRTGPATGLTVMAQGGGAIFLDAEATLPSATLLQEAWDFHCPPPGGS